MEGPSQCQRKGQVNLDEGSTTCSETGQRSNITLLNCTCMSSFVQNYFQLYDLDVSVAV